MDKQVTSRRVISYLFFLVGFSVTIVTGSKLWQSDFSLQVFGLAFFSIACVGYLIWRGYSHRAATPRTGLENGIIAIFVVLIMTWIFSADQREGMERVILLLGYGVLFYLLVDAFDVGLDQSAFFAALLTITAILMVAALLETSFVYRTWWERIGSFRLPPYPYRFVGLLGHPNALIALVNLAGPIAVVVFIKTQRRIIRFSMAVWLALYAIALIFSSSRGGLLGLFAWSAILVLVWLTARRRGEVRRWLPAVDRRRWLIVLAAALVIIFVIVLGVMTLSRHPSHGLDLFGSREPIWRTAISIWLSSPFFGVGPGRFPLAYLSANPHIPPDYWSTHAHNAFLQVMGESGIFGLFAVIWLIVIAVRVVLSMADRLPDQPYLAAVIAALVGFLAQSQVDEFSHWISIMLPMLALSAWLFSRPADRVERYASVRLSVFFIPVVVIILVSGIRLWAYYPAATAVRLGEQGYHKLAGQQALLSVSRDPNLFYYPQQTGMYFADAWYQDRDPLELELARSYLRRSMQLEPDVSWVWVNVATLDWLSYDLESAQLDIQKAVQHSPRSAVYHVNAGWFAEQLDDDDAAAHEYQLALQLKPDWATHPYWGLSPLRTEVLQGWLAQNSLVSRATYWYAAQLAVQRGDFSQVERLLAYAEWLGEPAVCRHRVEAIAHEAQGDLTSVERSYTAMLALMDNRTIESGNPLAETLSNWVYQRQGVPNDLVPGVINLVADCGQFASAEHYAALLREEGCCAEAAAVWNTYQQAMRGGSREILPPSPECQEE